MNLTSRVLLILAFGLAGCDDCRPTGTRMPAEFEFSRMTIKYFMADPSTQEISYLTVRGDGTVEAHRATMLDTLATGVSTLLDSEKRHLETLFADFWGYDRTYLPDQWDPTNQVRHFTSFDYDGIRHSVTVYLPDETDIPSGLSMIVEEMQRIWEAVINGAS